MKKKIIFFGILLVVILVIAVLWLVKTYVGDLRPVLLPPSKDLIEIIEKQQVGNPVDFPLKIASGFKIGVFAKELGKARDLQFSPGGTLLVSSKESGKVFALPDVDNDGKADKTVEVLKDLDTPHGLAFHPFNTSDGKQVKLFVAELRGVSRYSWDEENLSAKFEKKLFDLPYNGNHSTRSIVIDKNGNLFVSLGSSCNVCVEDHHWLATIVVSDTQGKAPRLYAKGLRNSVFIRLNPTTGELWGTEMGRDLIGDDLPPEEINIIREEKNYGWPTCYGSKVHDEQFDHNHKAGECEDTEAPIYKFQAHSAPLGLTFIASAQFPQDWQGDLLVAYHGSWNRSVPTGYKIVRMKVEGNKITADQDFITGFLQGSNALGRPVDVEFDKSGSLYISDDKIGTIYKVVLE